MDELHEFRLGLTVENSTTSTKLDRTLGSPAVSAEWSELLRQLYTEKENRLDPTLRATWNQGERHATLASTQTLAPLAHGVVA